jgi:subtilisin family serine protease
VSRFMVGRCTSGRLLPGCLVAGAAALCVTAAGGAPQAVHDSQWPLQTMAADRLWELSRGAGVTVAVIDAGVDASHPDLRGQVLRGADLGDGSSGDGTHDPGGEHSHGTQVASLIAGTAQNYDGDGLYGLAPEAKILPFGVYRDGAPDPVAMSRAVRAAVARDVSVMVVPGLATQHHHGLDLAVRQAIGHDVVVVSGVGDDPAAASPSYPSAIPGVVAVTATDSEGRVWESAEDGRHVVLAAPGVDILAAASDGRYWTGDDTGYAAAWVAGAAALVRAASPEWTAAQVIQRLIETARGGGDDGTDPRYGYGIVDPVRALTDPATPVAPTNPLVSASPHPQASHGLVTDAAANGSTPGDPVLRLLVAVGAALGGMLLFFAGLRILGRTLKPVDPTGDE